MIVCYSITMRYGLNLDGQRFKVMVDSRKKKKKSGICLNCLKQLNVSEATKCVCSS